MKGFASVTKEALMEMVENCQKVLDKDLPIAILEQVDKLVSYEIVRTNTRVWYRLWMLPKPRFSFDFDSVVEFSKNYEYDLFQSCPIESLKRDHKNSCRWLDRLRNLAESHFSENPIQIDIKTFNWISRPEKYIWIHPNGFYTLTD